jgi:hypothetical protein
MDQDGGKGELRIGKGDHPEARGRGGGTGALILASSSISAPAPLSPLIFGRLESEGGFQ